MKSAKPLKQRPGRLDEVNPKKIEKMRAGV
jgi:hypothetical protein